MYIFLNVTHNCFFEDLVDLVKIGWMHQVIQKMESEDVQTLEICLDSLNTMFEAG